MKIQLYRYTIGEWVFNNISMKLWAFFNITPRFKTIRSFLKISCNLKLKSYQGTSVWGFIKTHWSFTLNETFSEGVGFGREGTHVCICLIHVDI